MRKFDREASALGVKVLNAQRLVPNEEWGWVYQSQDRSHFLPAGHERLARFLLEQSEAQGAWKDFNAR